MKIDREQLLKAIKFLKPAIYQGENDDPMNFVHVSIDGDNCQLTACNGKIGKRVILTRSLQQDIEDDQEDNDALEYLIDKATLESFETLCQKHKAKIKPAAKDQTLKLIRISSHTLTSFSDRIIYRQPACTFPDIDKYFQSGVSSVDYLHINSTYLIDALKEFNDVIEVKMSGTDGPIYMKSDDLTYQAFFLPVKQGKE